MHFSLYFLHTTALGQHYQNHLLYGISVLHLTQLIMICCLITVKIELLKSNKIGTTFFHLVISLSKQKFWGASVAYCCGVLFSLAILDSLPYLCRWHLTYILYQYILLITALCFHCVFSSKQTMNFNNNISIPAFYHLAKIKQAVAVDPECCLQRLYKYQETGPYQLVPPITTLGPCESKYINIIALF